jgi:hypothetical protein
VFLLWFILPDIMKLSTTSMPYFTKCKFIRTRNNKLSPFIVNFKQFFTPGPVNDSLAIFRQNCSVHLRWFCYVNYKDFSTFFVSVYDGMGACSFSIFLFVHSSHFVSVTPLRSLVLLLSYSHSQRLKSWIKMTG